MAASGDGAQIFRYVRRPLVRDARRIPSPHERLRRAHQSRASPGSFSMSTAVGVFFGLASLESLVDPTHARRGRANRFGNGRSHSGTSGKRFKMRPDGGSSDSLGRLSPGRALRFGILLSILGFAELTWGVNCSPAPWTFHPPQLSFSLPRRSRAADFRFPPCGGFPGRCHRSSATPPPSGVLDLQPLGALRYSLFPLAVPAFSRHRLDVREDYERAGM